ncbi:MAG: TonB-dependent receptor [Desulfobulbaceae bacterium]|nr:TonB-dependent receptor [Desulfobulbaceae bacterium]
MRTAFLLTVLLFSTASAKLTPPKILEKLTPPYPIHLQRQGIEGVVIVQLLIDESGSVEKCTLQQPLNPQLDSLSIATAQELRFTPGQVDGENVAVELSYLFNFSLKEKIRTLRNNIRIQGQVVKKGSGKAIFGAEVEYIPADSVLFDLPREAVLQQLGTFKGQSFKENRLITTTDSLGNFNLRGAPYGGFSFLITSDESTPFHQKDTVVQGEILKLTARVTPVEYNRYEVVTSYHSSREVSCRQLSGEELGCVAGSSGDPFLALKSLPGVARTTYSDELIFRGARPEDNQYYLDDVEIPYLFHYGSIRSVVPSQALSEISFYPGAYGTYYGNCVGGIVTAETATPKDKKFEASVDFSTMDMGFYISGQPVNNLRMHAGGRISDRIGMVKSYITRFLGDGYIVPEYADYYTKLEFMLFENHQIDFSLLGAKDTLVVVSDNAFDPLESRRFNRVGLDWNWKISDKLTQQFIYGHLFTRERKSVSEKNVFGRLDQITIKTNYFRSRWDWQISEKLKLSGGLHGDMRHFGIGEVYIDSKTGKNYLKINSIINGYSTFSPWAEMEWNPVSPLNLKFGGRYDRYSELMHPGNPSLRLAMKYRFNKKHQIKMALGNYSQTPKPLGIVLYASNANPSLPSTKAAHYTAGHEWAITDRVDLDIQMYYNRRWDIPFEESFDDTTVWSEGGEGRSYGAEMLLRRSRSKNFSGWLAYTLSRSEEKERGDHKVIDNDQTHNLQLAGTFFLPSRWAIGTKFLYTTGSPTTPLDSSRVDSGDDLFHAYWGEKNSERLDPAIKMDLRISKKILFDKAVTEIYLDLPNVLHPLYKTPECRKFNETTGNEEIFYMPPVPTLGVKVSF